MRSHVALVIGAVIGASAVHILSNSRLVSIESSNQSTLLASTKDSIRENSENKLEASTKKASSSRAPVRGEGEVPKKWGQGFGTLYDFDFETTQNEALRYSFELDPENTDEPFKHDICIFNFALLKDKYREQLDAGTLYITSSQTEDVGYCDHVNFDPLILPAGIEPSADPLLSARSATYSDSFTRRESEYKHQLSSLNANNTGSINNDNVASSQGE